MPLPTLTKTWNYSLNNAVLGGGSTLTSHQNLLWGIKNALVTLGGWTHVASSNSGSTSTVSDLWVSPANLAFGGTGAARSWVIIKHPVTNWHFCIDLWLGGSQGTNAQTWIASMFMSKGGYNTASLATNAHPSTLSGDELTIFGQGTQVAWGNQELAHVRHYWYSTDLMAHRIMIHAADNAYFYLGIEQPQNPATGWIPGTNPTNMITTCLIAASFGTNVYTTASTSTRWGTTNFTIPFGAEGYGGGFLANNLPFPNEVTNEYPIVAPSFVSTTAPYRGEVGKPFDLWLGVSNIAAGTTYKNGLGERVLMQSGALILPWDNAAGAPLTR